MAIDCGKLTTGVIGYDCENPLVQGIKPRVVLINHDDIDLSETMITDGIITKLELKPGKVGYLVETIDPGMSANIAFTRSAYFSAWNQNVIMRLFDNNVAVKKFINGLAKTNVIVIVENKYVKYAIPETPEPPAGEEKRGETVFEVFGFYTGLRLNEATRDSAEDELKGGYQLTLGTSDSSQEPSLPLTWLDTNLTTTQEAFLALTTQA